MNSTLIFSFLIAFSLLMTSAHANKQKTETSAKKSLGKGPITKPGSYEFKLKVGESERYYKLHTPSNFSSKKVFPLVVALSGGSKDLSKDEMYGLVSKANKEGFIIAFPKAHDQTPPQDSATTWNAGACCGRAKEKKVDDVGFMKEMVQAVKKQVQVDPQKVFIVGMSNGAMMAYRLACEASDVFKGIAAVAGTEGAYVCKPEKTPSILHIHAKNDEVVPFNGGKSKKPDVFAEKAISFQSVPETVQKWVGRYSCIPTPQKLEKNEKTPCEVYQGCGHGAKIQVCVTSEGGHTWPGETSNEVSSKTFIANDIIWDFFKSVK